MHLKPYINYTEAKVMYMKRYINYAKARAMYMKPYINYTEAGDVYLKPILKLLLRHYMPKYTTQVTVKSFVVIMMSS